MVILKRSDRYAWVTAAFDKSAALEAIVLAHSMKRVAASADKVIIVPHDIEDFILHHLANAFDVVFPLFSCGLPLGNIKELEYALIYSWSFTMYDKCVFLHPNSLVVRNCDELFSTEEVSTVPIKTIDENVTSIAVLKPNIKTYRKLANIVFTKTPNNLTDVLNLAFNNDKQWKKHTLPLDYNYLVPSSGSETEKNLEATKIAHFDSSKPWRNLTEKSVIRKNPEENNDVLEKSWMSIFDNEIRSDLDAYSIRAFGLKESLFCCDIKTKEVEQTHPSGDSYTNALEGQSSDTLEDKSFHVLTLSTKSENDLQELFTKYADYLDRNPTVNINDLTFTANTSRKHFGTRLCVTGGTVEDLKKQIQNKNYISKTLPSKPKVAFLFTGHGSVYAEMARELYAANEVFRNAFNECLNIIHRDYDYELSLKDVLWNEKYHHYMNFICYSQAAIFSLAYSLTKMWKSFGVEPDFISGHSAGESGAATAAGILTLEEGMNYGLRLAELVHKHVPDGGMLILRATQDEVAKTISRFFEGKCESEEEWLDISLVNSPNQIGVSGPRKTVEMFNVYCQESGIKCQLLPGRYAFHSRAIEVIRTELKELTKKFNCKSPNCLYVSGRSGRIVGPQEVHSDMVEGMMTSVQYPAAAKTLVENGCNVFIEIGATPVLLSLCMASTSPGENVLWLPSIRKNENNWKTVLDSVGKLYANGYDINWSSIDTPLGRKKLLLPSPATKHPNPFYMVH